MDVEHIFRKCDDYILMNNKIVNDPVEGIPLTYFDDIEKLQKDIRYAKNNLDKVFKNNTWYKKEKQESFMIGILLANLKQIEKIGVNIDHVITMICCLINTNKSKTFIRLPDRLMVVRTQTSQRKVNDVMYLLSRIAPNLFELKRIKGDIYFKINREQLLADPYIKTKISATDYIDKKTIFELRELYETIYCYPHTERYIRTQLRDIILGVSYYYTLMVEEFITPAKQLEDWAKYGRRNDIFYLEVPIHIISKITGIPSKQIMSKLNTLCRSCNYIKKHNEVYVDGHFNHYYNEEYKTVCDRKKYDEIEQEEGKRPVTPFSYILFMENFAKTKTGKRILNNDKKYITMILRELKYKVLDEKYGRTDNYYEDGFKLSEEEVEEVFQGQLDYTFEGIEELFSEGNVQASIVDRHSLKQLPGTRARVIDKVYTKSLYTQDGHLKNSNILCIKLHKILTYLPNCKKDEYNYYIKLYNVIVDKIKEDLLLFKHKCIEEYNKLTYRISKYSLESIFGSILYSRI